MNSRRQIDLDLQDETILASKAQDFAGQLINKGYLEMEEIERELYNAPIAYINNRKEVLRLRDLVRALARNEMSEAQKQILLAE